MNIIIPALALMLPCLAAAGSDFAQSTAPMPLAIHPTAASIFEFKNVTVGDAKSDVIRKAGNPGLRGHPGNDQEVWYYIEDNLRVAVTFDRDVVTSVATTIF
ncbi:hypothetical protein ACYX7E_14680 [Luteimonas sp. RIT-PG2_3]